MEGSFLEALVSHDVNLSHPVETKSAKHCPFESGIGCDPSAEHDNVNTNRGNVAVYIKRRRTPNSHLILSEGTGDLSGKRADTAGSMN